MSGLLALLHALEQRDYRFVTITPASHARVAARWSGVGAGLRDLFGWSRAVDPASIEPDVLAVAEAAGVLFRADDGVRSSVRVSSVAGRLFLHSAFPTDGRDAVFLGPDSYRFAALIADTLRAEPDQGLRIIDIGAGAGVGGIVAARLQPGSRLTMTDVNPAALRLARVNAEAAGIDAVMLEGNGIAAAEGEFDLALLNPPFIIDAEARMYRDGGGMHGTALPLELARAGMSRLAPGGRLVLYSGAPVVDGEDGFRARLAAEVEALGCTLHYRELDPDVFGEELDRPAYRDVERIALVAAIVSKGR